MLSTPRDPRRCPSVLMRLPSEVLALCFCWLPFRDCMTASHVSRLWRAISLKHPAVWADIDVSGTFANAPELLRMALSRAGTHPLSISGSPVPDPERIVAQCLQEHLHHVRCLYWHLPEDSLPLNISGPLLEDLVCASYHVDIPEDFLGGQPARLRNLDLFTVSLPRTCPALSTVTHLTLDGSVQEEHAATYGRLFDLFPNLTSLSLHELYPVFASFLPAGPAPQSLQKLFLSTLQDGYDLMPHFTAWQTQNLRQIDLNQRSVTLPQLSQLVDAAGILHIVDDGDLSIIASSPRRAFGVSIARRADTPRAIANAIIESLDELSDLAHLVLPITLLLTFLPVIAALPKLLCLELRIEVKRGFPAGHAAHLFPWDLLPRLLRVHDARPTLGKIILHVVCPYKACPLERRDAQRLMNSIMDLRPDGTLPRDMCLKGFPRGTCSAVQDYQPDDLSFKFSFMYSS